MTSRRSFILGSLGLGAASLAIGSKIYNQSKVTTEDIGITKNEVFIPSLNSSFDGFRIGILSDPHLSTCGGVELLKRAVDLLSVESLDILVLGGDYVLILDIFTSRYFYTRYSKYSQIESCVDKVPSFSHGLEIGEYYFQEVAREVSRLNPKHGIIAVLGNHDRWNSAENCIRIFNEYQIRMLVNDSLRISQKGSELEFYGSDDYGTGIPEAPERISIPRILISHNPDFLAELSESGLYQLGLAGHTHGGQVVLPGIGAIVWNIHNTQLIRGLIQLNDAQILISNGVGTSGIPLRLNCPPEVNLITLRA